MRLRGSRFRTLAAKLRGLIGGTPSEDEIGDEIQEHLQLLTARFLARGLSKEEAIMAARRQFGSTTRVREDHREMQTLRSIEAWWQDVRYALRTLRKRPGFTIAAVLTLAIGIGASTSVFSVVYGVLLKPMPFDDPERLVGMWHTAPELGFDLFNQSPATYFTYRDENRVFQDISLWTPFPDVSITGNGDPERVQALYVTDSLLPILKVQPFLGRLFTKADDAPGSPDRTMLTYGYWQRRFGGTHDVVGHTVDINGRPFEVVGVLPSSFRFLNRNPAVLLPLRLNSAGTNLGGFDYNAIARLKPGVTIAQANDDVARMIPLVWERHPPRAGEQKILLRPNVRPLSDDVIGEVGRLLWILLGTVGIVLVVACANVANLFLVRAEGRRREFAVRTALGASRVRLTQGLLSECLTLGLVGGVVGLGLARAGIGLVIWLAPSKLPRLEEIGLHPVVLLFTLTIAIVAALLLGLLAVLKLGAPMGMALQEGGRSASESPQQHRTRNTLVVAQVALALVLLVVSALMVRTFIALRQVDAGFTRPEQVQTLRIAVPKTLTSDPAQTVQVHEQIAERLRQLPGVQSVGLASSITLDGIYFNGAILVEEFPDAVGRARKFRRHKFIAPGYFETMGNQLLLGRTITWRDIYQDGLVAVVSAQLAHEYWGSPATAIGKRIRVSANQPWREIIGVVGNEFDDGLNHAPPAIAYWPMAMKRFVDQPFIMPTMSYAIRSERIHSPGFLHELERAVWSVNPNLPLANVRTLEDIRAASMAQTSFALTMLVIAAVMALCLSVIGLYGVIAYILAQRTREIGIRMALGARPGDVSRLFVHHGLRLTALGVALGIGAALGFTRLMSSLVFGISTTDLVTYVSVSASLGGIALLATYLPARRASRIDPISALRWDM
jgi:putative ABC transport system permease protein